MTARSAPWSWTVSCSVALREPAPVLELLAQQRRRRRGELADRRQGSGHVLEVLRVGGDLLGEVGDRAEHPTGLAGGGTLQCPEAVQPADLARVGADDPIAPVARAGAVVLRAAYEPRCRDGGCAHLTRRGCRWAPRNGTAKDSRQQPNEPPPPEPGTLRCRDCDCRQSGGVRRRDSSRDGGGARTGDAGQPGRRLHFAGVFGRVVARVQGRIVGSAGPVDIGHASVAFQSIAAGPDADPRPARPHGRG